MSTDTLERTDIDADIASMVEAAFEELDCVSTRKDKIPCGGEIRGWVEYHDCIQGWLCAVHWQLAIEVLLPQLQAKLKEQGHFGCAHCMNRFNDIRKYVRFTGK